MAEIPIFCGDCGATGAVGRVTAGLQCVTCGSRELGLLGVDPMPAHFTASVTGNRNAANDPDRYARERAEGHGSYDDGGATEDDREDSERQDAERRTGSRRVAYPQGPHTGWGKPMPSPTRGWSDYAGPLPATTPRDAPVADSQVCPACNGSGYDLIDKTTCRECQGTGTIVNSHPTSKGNDYLHPQTNDATTSGPPTGGARWQGKGAARITDGGPEDIIRSSTPQYGGVTRQMHNTSPNVYKRNDDYEYAHGDQPLSLSDASCPSCGHAPTEVKKDRQDNAWWHCPNCGSLANLDRTPEVNPYEPGQDFTPNRKMKVGVSIIGSRNVKTGKLFTIMAKATEHNQLTPAEALTLARRTLISFGE